MMDLLRAMFLAACWGADGLSVSGVAKDDVSSDKPPWSLQSSRRQSEQKDEPRVAVLLVGLPRGWTHDYVHDLLNGVVEPHRADVFVHMCDEDGGDLDGFVKKIGTPVQKVGNECTQGGPHAQFWHLRRAFDNMQEHETKKGFAYDVVIKMRTEISPAASDGGTLDLAGWEKKGRLHMMTDMFFWGQRKEMAVMADFFASRNTFFEKQYPDPFDRPINLRALYETYMRDPRNAPNVTSKAPWYAYNKLEAIPYPDNGIQGAIESLQAALDDGITVCPSEQCSLRCGERYDVLCKGGDETMCGKFGCRNHPDYAQASMVAEKDILTWPLSHGIILCDIGRSVNPYRGKKGVEARKSRDCD